MKQPGHLSVTQHHGYLGTVVELRIEAVDEDACDSMDLAAIAEIEHLEHIFNLFDPTSEISRWRRGEGDAGPEIRAVLEDAIEWRRRTGGAFDPYVGPFREAWTRAAAERRMPTSDELADAAGRQDTASVDLNGIAKGWIVDRAVVAAMAVPGAQAVTVNGGGDIRHTGPRVLRVGIEDPGRPYDNVPALAVIGLQRGAIATSGGARRGWVIDGTWFSHVIDPRSGMPADSVLQVSVIAETACVADVVATALTVLDAVDREQLVASLDRPIGYLVVDRDGQVTTNPEWDQRRVS
jgi:thiamine biosynthesis lipoprotein